MPNIRLKAWGETPNSVIVARPFPIIGRTLGATSVTLPFALVRLYRTLDDLVFYRSQSDASGNYTLNAYDLLTYYVAAFLHSSADTTQYMADNATLTADLGAELAGISVDTLVGV